MPFPDHRSSDWVPGRVGKGRPCAYCGWSLPIDARPNRLYCSQRCRNLRWERDNPDKARVHIWSWNARHRGHVAARARRWYERNRTQALETSREWSRSNRHRKNVHQRARQYRLDARSWQADDFTRAQELLGGVCAYCGAAGPLTLDHVVPLVRGGAHRIENLVAACKACNSRKGARDELEFRALLALEAFIDGRRGGVGEDEAPYRVARPCRRPRHRHVRIRDRHVARQSVRRRTRAVG